jgi:hypothetical protein
MSKNSPGSIVPSNGGFLHELALQVKLILRLIADPRVNPLLKILPVGSLLYCLIPDLAVGPIDDGAVVFIGMYLFVELCPPEVVEEHRRLLERPAAANPSEEIIDAEFHSVNEEQPTPDRKTERPDDR